MFILKKILNCATTVPECIRLKTDGISAYHRGLLLYSSGDGIAKNSGITQTPTHICCEDLKEGEGDTVLCYAITDAMIFSAVASGDMRSIHAGTKVQLTTNDDGYVCLVSNDTQNGTVTVVNNCGAKNAGDRLLISFSA